MWDVSSRVEARRIKEVLRIPEGGGLDAVLRCVNHMSWAAKCSYRVERQAEAALLTITACPPRRRASRPVRRICMQTHLRDRLFKRGVRHRSVGQGLLQVLSTRPHPSDSWCQWEFRAGV